MTQRPLGVIKPITYAVEANGCHRCTSHSPKNCGGGGYPMLKIYRKRKVMSRYIYETKHNVIIDDKLVIRHKCDNKWCINVDHLETGTHADNLRDSYERQPRRLTALYGENNMQSKITAKQVQEIRAIQNQPLRIIAQKYSLGTSQVWRIRKNLSWNTPKTPRGETR